MKRFILCILLLVPFCMRSPVTAQMKGKEGPTHRKDSLICIRNLRYAPEPDALDDDTSSDKTLDIYLPAVKRHKKLPVLVFVHGGGFSGGDKQGTAAICAKIAMQGFAVVSINYWLTLKHHKVSGASATANMSKGIPSNKQFHPALQQAVRNASNDLISSLKWLKKNARKYHLDASKVALSGGSAGAMTVLHTAYASGQKVIPIQGVVDLWGGLEDVSIIKKGAPPILIYHGDKDKLINVAFAYALEAQMDDIGTPCILHIMQGKGHARYDFIQKEKIGEIARFLNRIFY